MKQIRKGRLHHIRYRAAMVLIAVTMIVSQLPFSSFIYADSGIAQVSFVEPVDAAQTIKIEGLQENIKKVTLTVADEVLETRQVNGVVEFTVYANGTYVLHGYDEQGTEVGQQSIEVEGLSDLEITEDAKEHRITIVSRNYATKHIMVSGAMEEEALMIDQKNGVYQAVIDVEKNGTYTFTAKDDAGNTIGETVKEITDVPSVTQTGEILINSVDDLKQIKANPEGSFVLGQDIEVNEEILHDVTFRGTLDGQGYCISGAQTLFHAVEGARLRNVVIKGTLAKSGKNTLIEDSGFYIEGKDAKTDYAVVLHSEDMTFHRCFSFMNVEGNKAAGFLLNGSGDISDSYVSGYMNGKEVYGFGSQVNVTNSYITASLTGEKRVVFTNGKRTECFYDAQINDLEDSDAKPLSTETMISGSLGKLDFQETAGNYPEIKQADNLQEAARRVSALSVVSVKTASNLSALQGDVSTVNQKDIEWSKKKDEITAQNKGEDKEVVNRFALQSPKTVSEIKAGGSTSAKTTQIVYPTQQDMYYIVTAAADGQLSLPATHEAAVEAGWKLMYWSGTHTQNNLQWHTEYTVYQTDLKEIKTIGSVMTNYGKNGGKLTLDGTYDIGETMQAELIDVRTTKGTMYWETADRLDATTWTQVQKTTMQEKAVDSYTVKADDNGKYLRVRFETAESSGYTGSLHVNTKHIVQQPIQSVKIENKTSNSSVMTVNDQLIASIEPTGKDNEVSFLWYHDKETEKIAAGRNYTLKPEDLGKQIIVKAVAKSDGELKGEKSSSPTSAVQAIKNTEPDIKHLQEQAHDDITVTLSMKTAQGLYQFGYSTEKNGAITPYTTLSRANTSLTITGLQAHTKYYVYVKQIGENGYADSDWSTQPYEFTTDAEHVRGDVMISGDAVYAQTLTADIQNKPAAHTGSFLWYRLDHDGERIEDTRVEGTSYPLKQADIGHKIEAVYQGTGEYAGEVTNVSDTVEKEEKAAPETNLTVKSASTETDTTIEVELPENTDGEKYIIGLSKTKSGIPIEVQEENKIKEFASSENYRITNLERDTTYYLFIRYAENATHMKSDWISPDKAVKQKTAKKEFSGTITFEYETENDTLMRGHTVTAILTPRDADFNYKGTWTWTKTVSGATTTINSFTLSSDKHSTSYTVPEDEDVNTVYTVRFEANVGYQGETSKDTAPVQEIKKEPYAKPEADSIVLEPVDDGSIKVKMSDGEGKYQFYYKEQDQNPADSINGFFTELFTGDDGYTKADKTVGSNVDLVIEGLDRYTTYIVKVQRVADEHGEASAFAYSSEKDTNDCATTLQTDIAGHVTISGTERYHEQLSAEYNKATYSSTGSGTDENGTWKWYRDDVEIIGETGTTYTLQQEDIGKSIKAEYTIPDREPFQGSASASTRTIEKEMCVNPEITDMESKDIDKTLTMIVQFDKNADDTVYYRLQKAAADAPAYPATEEELKQWHEVTAETVHIIKDANDTTLKAKEDYTLYYIKKESATQNGSEMLSKAYRMGTMSQNGTVTFTGDFVVGKSVTATMKDSDNVKGTWHWYMSTERYGYDIKAVPSETDADAWQEINDGFYPKYNEDKSTLTITNDMFAHYIRAEFTADEEAGYSGSVKTTEEAVVKKVYDETITITSSTKDGYGNPKAYMNSVITGTVNHYAENGDLDREVIQFKIGSIIISGTDLAIDGNKFTYTMPNKKEYDGNEITAEVSTPKYPELLIKEDLTTITTEILNSKTSTDTAFTYAQGMSISSADDLEKFMKMEEPYNDRSSSSYYIVTNNIDMTDKGVIAYSETPFAGTLIGDYHTIIGTQNPIFAFVFGESSSKFANIGELVFLNSNIDTIDSGEGIGSGAAIVTRQANYVDIYQVMLTESTMNGVQDAGFLTGTIISAEGKNENTDAKINECFSAGGMVKTQSGSLGSLIGYIGGGTIKNSGAVNTPIGSGYLNKGGMIGAAKKGVVMNCYAASFVSEGKNVGGLVSRQGVGDYPTFHNGFYDEGISGIPSPVVYTGTPKKTKDMISTSLQYAFGVDGTWTYKTGYYPQLTWVTEISNASNISNLYTATRGAFTSVDGLTSSDDMFEGNVSGVIQLPVELMKDSYSVRILDDSGNEDSSVIQVGANGTLVPIKAGKATVEITYTEPDETIGGTATNTFEFTVKDTVTPMTPVSIVEKDGSELKKSPEMNQVIKASSTEGTSFQWYKRKAGSVNSEAIADATGTSYTITSKDIGYEFGVLVKADGYADTYSDFTKAAVAIQAEAPAVSDITDSSVTLRPVHGEDSLTYEFGYKRSDEATALNVVEETCDKDGSITIDNLLRNKEYEFFVRVAAQDGSYSAGDWSGASKKRLLKTAVGGTILLGNEINNGRDLHMKIEAVNGQTGVWKLERLDKDDKVLETKDTYSTANDCSYTFTTEDVGNRIRVTYTGSGDYDGTKTAETDIIRKKMPETTPDMPEKITETDGSLTVKVGKAGTKYDIGYAKSSKDAVTVSGNGIEGGAEYTIGGLTRNTSYYIYARNSATDDSEASQWSSARICSTAKSTVDTQELSLRGDLMTDQEITITAPALKDLSGIWKVERKQDGKTTTIAPKNYTVDTKKNTLRYTLTPKDAMAKLTITFTGTGDYTGTITKTSNIVQNGKQDSTSDMPSDVIITEIKDHTVKVSAKDGSDIYQFGYALKDEASIVWTDATAEAGNAIRLGGLSRNSTYDIYVRKVAKTGYVSGDPVKMPSPVTTEKTALNGTISYTLQDGDLKVGEAQIGKTYQAAYTSGKYEQSGTDTGGTWQWYADDTAIEGADSYTYTVGEMEGSPLITARYIAKEDSGFTSYVNKSIGTLTKPEYDIPEFLPSVTALPEDGEFGSKLQITTTDAEHVFYYIQKADDTTLPQLKRSSEVRDNTPATDQWFPAAANVRVTTAADTEYVVYIARLEDGSRQCSGIVSLRAVRTVKENLNKLDQVSVKEADDTSWKILQDKELRIQVDDKAVEGVWQYYVTQDKSVDSSWQNITAELKRMVREGKTDAYTYTVLNLPVKYYDYYVKAVFSGRGSYQGSKTYIADKKLIGTQIKGSVSITSGDTSEVFTPIEASYEFAKDAHGDSIIDEENGIWTWYRETEKDSGTYEKIEGKSRAAHVGVKDSYTPTAADVDKKIYAVYTGAPKGIFSGTVQSDTLDNVERVAQATPDKLIEKQVNGTTVQLTLPSNYKAEGRSIPSIILEYRIKGSSEDWSVQDDGSTWLGVGDDKLKPNTEYEIRVKFAGTSEYLPSAYSELLYVKTEKQSFDADRLKITGTDPMEMGTVLEISYQGDGCKEGEFVLSRSDGQLIEAAPAVTEGDSIRTTYTVTAEDIGNNIIVQYRAKADAQAYSGSIEKDTAEVLKTRNPALAQTPVLTTVSFDETVLKTAIDPAYEYVLSESTLPVSETSAQWRKLKQDKDGTYTFTGLDKTKTYYLHARIAETQQYRNGNESVSAPVATWSNTTHTITYQGVEGAVNGTENLPNPTQFTELSEDIVLLDASKDGYTFTGWTSADSTTPVKGITIPKNTTQDQVFTANWEVTSYAITYELNGGSLAAGDSNPVTYTIESDDIVLKNPVRKGYTFTGWSWEDETEGQTEVTIAKGSFGAKTFVASWEEDTYSIDYELAGGTNAKDNPSQYKITSADIELEEPTRTGYTFTGWTWDGQTSPVKAVTIDSGSVGDRTYTANWETIAYTITYELNGGSLAAGDSNPATYTIESSNITLHQPTRTGYEFLGWLEGDADTPLRDVTIQTGTTGNKRYTADWKAITYTITYDLAGGVNAKDNPASYTITDADITLAAPSRVGHIFKGWKKDGSDTAQETVIIAGGSSGNLSYTATWEKVDYVVTYAVDGGSSVPQSTVKYDETVSKPADPNREGYTFAGWYRDSSFKTAWDFEHDVVTQDMTLYAKWNKCTYTATFDKNGGDSITKEEIIKSYQEVLGILPITMRKGYRFEGWYTEKEGGDKIDATTVMPLNGATYHAHWKLDTYTITYDLNDGGNGAVNAAGNPDVYTVEDPSVSLQAPTWKDHVFLGWTYEGQTDAVSDVVISKGSTGNRHYTANWAKGEYIVRFEANGGNTSTAVGVDRGEAVTRPADPVKDGYTFKGWFTSSDLKTAWDFDKSVEEDMTLYAKWEINRYTVTFDTGGGNAVQQQIVNHGERLKAVQTQEKAYYEFAGWYQDVSLSERYDLKAAITEDKTLYANWIPVRYEIVYDLNGGSNPKENPDSYTVEDAFELKEPVKEGCSFLGWTYEGKTQRQVTIKKGTHGTLRYVANWTSKGLTIYFDSNGGSTISSVTVKRGEKIIRPTDPVRAGYVFEGWYTTTNLDTAWDFDTVVDQNVTLYAKWMRNVDSSQKPSDIDAENKDTTVNKEQSKDTTVTGKQKLQSPVNGRNGSDKKTAYQANRKEAGSGVAGTKKDGSGKHGLGELRYVGARAGIGAMTWEFSIYRRTYCWLWWLLLLILIALFIFFIIIWKRKKDEEEEEEGSETENNQTQVS